MGQISRSLAVRLSRAGPIVKQLRQQVQEAQQQTDLVPHPLHNTYVAAQNVTSIFAELVSAFPEMSLYAGPIGEAEDTYMPGGPPMSPLTTSYFTCWAFYDFRFGRDRETIGTCLLDVSGEMDLSPLMFTAIRQMQRSRMGIYEWLGQSGFQAQLGELVTDDRFTCHVSSEYAGSKGELWYVRLCPPLPGFDEHVTFTTPYVLQRSTREDWSAYLKKRLAPLPGADEREKLYKLMKYGRYENGWNEFVFQAYLNHQMKAIFLAGIPDINASLPHADTTGKRPCG